MSNDFIIARIQNINCTSHDYLIGVNFTSNPIVRERIERLPKEERKQFQKLCAFQAAKALQIGDNDSYQNFKSTENFLRNSINEGKNTTGSRFDSYSLYQ